ncbi:MAG: helix-turn-helix domain-containing protein [Halodesulfurarchaeum sp.]
MQTLTLDMVQYDCPYIQTTLDHDVMFYTKHWDFHEDQRELETRIFVRGQDEGALSNGLEALSSNPNLLDSSLLSRRGPVALIRSTIHETNAMHTIREHNGYVTGPFVIADGSEQWNVGFDTADGKDRALADLERHNEFDVEDEWAIGLGEYFEILQHAKEIRDLVHGLRKLTDTERETLEAALTGGYFGSPRGATLQDLADEFDISKMGVSKNLRRSQRKVLRNVVFLLNQLDAEEDSPFESVGTRHDAEVDEDLFDRS